MDLNTLLDEAAPHAADPGPELQALLDELVVATRPTPTRRRRGLALVSGGVVLAGALSVTGAAAAAIVMSYTRANVPDSLVHATYSWTSQQGHSCTIGVDLGPRPNDDPNYSSSQQAELDAAQQWAASFDVNSIDLAAAEELWLDHMQRISADDPSRAELRRRFQGDELEGYAVHYELTRQLDNHLEAQGFDPRSLNSGAGVECPQ